MNILTLFIVAVAALFNVGQLPQPLPTVYQLTLNSVESVVCDPSSSRRSTICSVFDTLRLPAPHVTFSIAAPPLPPVTSTNSSLLNEPPTEADLRLPPKVASQALIVSPSTSSQSTSTSSTWMLPTPGVILQLFCGLLLASCIGLASILIWCNFDTLLGSILRGLTWFFCDPLPRRHRATLKDYYWSTIDRVDYGDYSELNLYYEPDLPAVRVVSPTPFNPPADTSEPPAVEGPYTTEHEEPRRRVRSATRCQRVKKQKAQAHEEQQNPEPAPVQAEEPELEDLVEPVEPRRNRRGGKQVRRRQRYQELKEARRAVANAEAGPSTRPQAVPVFNDDNFPALPGAKTEAQPVQYRHSFAVVAKVGHPSANAAIHRGSWIVKINAEPESPPRRLELDGRGAEGSWAIGIEDGWIDLEEEAWRKGRRKKKKKSS